MAYHCLGLIFILLAFLSRASARPLRESCSDYAYFSKQRSIDNLSTGLLKLPYKRPPAECRKFKSQAVEETIARLQTSIKDPDLFRLFENTFPNTLDTAVRWTGHAVNDNGESTDEDLAFIITGDINAMWLRDSANQILSYLPLLQPSSSDGTLASLFRGLINLHSRYIKISPYCHAFQPPVESGIAQQTNYAYSRNTVNPSYDKTKTFDCKWELDSLASFLQISVEYYNVTGDMGPFEKYKWVETVEVILDAVEKMRTGTYLPDGRIGESGYTMKGQTDRATETTSNNGLGNPVKANTGLVRSTFRPSDDSTIFQFLIPSNMMFARFLDSASSIMQRIGIDQSRNLTARMRTMASEIREGISKYGIISHPLFGAIYAFEVDGYGSANLMDDANLPSLLSAPLLGFVDPHDEVYLNTRLFVLSEENPYWMHGPFLSAIGGPHNGPIKGWPLACIVRILTSSDGEEIRGELRQLMRSTDGLGLMHESVNAHDIKDWSREWFSWANGMFGQMILDLERRKPKLLEESYQ